jgi:hypothetical protein
LTQPRDQVTFRQFLLEDDDEDIVSGLRKLVSDIRTNWRSPFSSTRAQELKLWKRLSSEQQDNLHQLFTDVVQGLLVDVTRPVNINVFRPTTKHEAAYIPLAFQTLSQGAAEIGKGVLSSTEARGIIDDKQASQFESQYDGDGNKPLDVTIGKVISDFISAHRSELTKIVGQYEDDGVCFKVPAVRMTFLNAIESKKTPPERRAEAVRGVHYLLLKMSSQLFQAGRQVESKYKGASLPDEPPQSGKPPGGISKPVTKP